MFFIRSMGCDYHHESDFMIERPHGYGCFLALFIKSRSRLPDGEELKSCEPYSFILFNISSPHRYGADGEEYIEDWIQFECDESFLSRHDLPFDRPVHIGESVQLDKYFSLIRDVFFRCINDNEIIDHLMQAMLTEVSDAAAGDRKAVPHFGELLGLRRKIHAEPGLDWSVDKMAKLLHISQPYMQELYRKAFNISCISDVIECRVSYAKSLLSGSDMPIEEIAAKCGYNSAIHFSRQFRQIAGIPPNEWRKKHING